MHTDQQMEERLWDYLDGAGSVEERSVIESLIEQQLQWKAKYHELLEFQSMLQSSELDEPSMRFTKNIMEEIGRLQVAPAASSYINKNIITGLSFFFVTMLILLIGYSVGQVNWHSGDGASSINYDLNIEKYNPAKLVNNTWIYLFTFVNVILGLYFFDRYLANKKKNLNKEA